MIQTSKVRLISRTFFSTYLIFLNILLLLYSIYFISLQVTINQRYLIKIYFCNSKYHWIINHKNRNPFKTMIPVNKNSNFDNFLLSWV